MKNMKLLKKKIFSLEDKEKYLLLIALTNKDSILFKLNRNEEIFSTYYELNYKTKLLPNKEMIFKYSLTPKDSFVFITENLEKNIKNAKINLNDDEAELTFDINTFGDIKKKIQFNLNKKEVDINLNINKLKTKIINDQKNQDKLEEKTKEIKELLTKRIEIEKELSEKIKEIKKIQSDFINSDKIKNDKINNEIFNNKKNISINVQNIKKIKDEIESIKKTQKKMEINIDINMNNQLKNIEKNLGNLQNTIKNNDNKINLVETNQVNLENNMKKIEGISNKLNLKYNKSNNSILTDINFLKNENEKMKNDIQNILQKLQQN